MTLASFALVAAMLYFAKAVFIPIAMALLFTFLLTPLVVRLQKWKLPKWFAIIVTVTLTFSVVAFVTWLVSTQLISLAQQLPRYEQNLHTKIQSLRGTQRPGVFSRAAEVIKGVERELEMAATAEEPAPRGTDEKPVAVEVKPPKPTIFDVFRRTLGPLLAPVATAGIVVLLVVAMLVKREDLRDRFIKVVSGGRLNVATEAVDEAARRISRYLLMLLMVNVTYGIPIGVGLHFIGVPNALLWGLLATLLRFIPFLGPWIASVFPLALAFAVDPGWSKLLLTVGLFVTVELISNNLVEPWLYGSSTGVSVVAVIAGAIFWTWLWGPIGLFLAMPLTVAVVVMGKYVPGLRFINEMFGSDPVMEPHARFYQRMLAMDAEEMLRLAEEYLEQHDLAALCDQVMIPALNLAESDRQTGQLAEMRQHFIVQSCRELIEDLGERECFKRSVFPGADSERVLCVPARDDADELAALMLVQVLRCEGIAAEMTPATIAPGECENFVRRHGVRTVFVSALPPAALAPARRLCRSLKQNCRSLKVIVGLWTPKSAGAELSQRLASAHPDGVVTTMRAAIQQVAGKGASTAPQVPRSETKALPGVEPFRAADAEDLFDIVKREVARTFNVPMSLVSIVGADPNFWKAHRAPVAVAQDPPDPLRESTICVEASEAGGPVIVEDVSRDKRHAEDAFLQSRGIQSYVATPLRSESGYAVGTLCVLDTKPRTVRKEEVTALQTIAQKLMRAIESRPAQAA